MGEGGVAIVMIIIILVCGGIGRLAALGSRSMLEKQEADKVNNVSSKNESYD